MFCCMRNSAVAPVTDIARQSSRSSHSPTPPVIRITAVHDSPLVPSTRLRLPTSTSTTPYDSQDGSTASGHGGGPVETPTSPMSERDKEKHAAAVISPTSKQISPKNTKTGASTPPIPSLPLAAAKNINGTNSTRYLHTPTSPPQQQQSHRHSRNNSLEPPSRLEPPTIHPHVIEDDPSPQPSPSLGPTFPSHHSLSPMHSFTASRSHSHLTIPSQRPSMEFDSHMIAAVRQDEIPTMGRQLSIEIHKSDATRETVMIPDTTRSLSLPLRSHDELYTTRSLSKRNMISSLMSWTSRRSSQPLPPPPSQPRRVITRVNRVKHKDGTVSINEYDVIRVIGRGTFGSVKLAQHRMKRHYVAIKQLSKSMLKRTRRYTRDPNRSSITSSVTQQPRSNAPSHASSGASSISVSPAQQNRALHAPMLPPSPLQTPMSSPLWTHTTLNEHTTSTRSSLSTPMGLPPLSPIPPQRPSCSLSTTPSLQPSRQTSLSNLFSQISAFDKIDTFIQIFQKLNHNHVLSLLDVIHDPDADYIYLVMEYATRGAVMEWDADDMQYKSTNYPTTARGGLAESTVQTIAAQVVQGLAYLHSNRVIHRDLKPDNLLMFDDEIVKIGDFGSARMFPVGHDTLLTDTGGTYHFMCPEICAGQVHDGFKADMWSLGITLYTLLYGNVPWFSLNMVELFDNIQHASLVFPTDSSPHPISHSCRDLITRLLNKDATERPSIETVLKHPWLRTGIQIREKKNKHR